MAAVNGDQMIADNFGMDMFGRLKVSNPVTLFDASHRYRANPDFSDETTSGGTVTYLANESTSSLNVTTTSGSKVTRESNKVFQYQPGKALQVFQTFVMAPPQENLRQRVGYFSRTNGIYLEQDGETINLVMRTYTSGAVEEIRVPQEHWDRERLIAERDTDLQLDLTAAQIFFIELEWLGVGSVKCGFVIGGAPIVVHQFDHANWIKKVYMQTATLPVRYEIENAGATSQTSSLKQICATVISNGGFDWKRRSYNASRTAAISTTTTYKPLVSIRMAPGRTDSIVIPSMCEVHPTSNGNYEAALILNATLTGGTWVNSETGNVQYNIGETAMTGGSVLATEYFSSSNQARMGTHFGGDERLYMQLGRSNADVPVSETLTLAVRNITGTGDAVGSFSWFDNT
jgi:hypothetical protein